MSEDKEAFVKGTINASLKHCVNIGRFVKGKKLIKMINYLNNVMKKKNPIPFKTFNDKISHKKGMGPGKYPIKASEEVIKLLKSVKSNADSMGMDEDKLVIKTFIPNRVFSKESRSKYRRGKYTYLNIGVVEKND